MSKTLYARLGGYDGIAAVADDLLPRLVSDPQLERFWKHRGEDGVRREKQLLIDFLCASAGGPLYYVGRDMKTSHRGLGISERKHQEGHLGVMVSGEAREEPSEEKGGWTATASVDCGSGRPAHGTPREALPQCAATVPPRTSRGTASYCMARPARGESTPSCVAYSSRTWR